VINALLFILFNVIEVSLKRGFLDTFVPVNAGGNFSFFLGRRWGE